MKTAGVIFAIISASATFALGQNIKKYYSDPILKDLKLEPS